LDDGELDSLGARKRDHWAVLADDEHVGCTGRELLSSGIFQMDNIEATHMFFFVFDDSNTTQVATRCDNGQGTGVELDVVLHLAVGQVEFDAVAGLDERIGIAEGAAVMGDDIGNLLVSNRNFSNLQQFKLGFLRSDSVNSKTTLGIVKQTEVLICFLNCNNIHKASRIVDISSNLAVDFDEALGTD